MLHQSKTASFVSNIAEVLSPAPKSRLSLVPSGETLYSEPDLVPEHDSAPRRKATPFLEIAGERCSGYLAEAAVLVLVFAILDRLIVKDRMEWTWAGGAVAISLGLLLASIAVELAVRRLESARTGANPVNQSFTGKRAQPEEAARFVN